MLMRKSILHLSTQREWGGGEAQLCYLYHALAKQQCRQTIICQKGSALAEYCLKHQLNFKTWTCRGDLSLKAIWQCKHWSDKKTILHAHDARAHSIAVLSSLIGNKAPIILSRKVVYPIKNKALTSWKYNHPRVKKIICISQAVYDQLSSQIKNTKRLTIISDGIDVARYQTTTAADLKLSKDTTIIGMVAQFRKDKDQKTFIEIAKQLIALDIKAHFILIGDGETFEASQSLVKQYGLENKILFTGFRPDIENCLAAMDIFLFTSRSEGLGSVLLEAMAAGLPIVAARSAGAMEIIQHQSNGLLFDVGNSEQAVKQIKRLLASSDVTTELSKQAKNFVNDYTVEHMANKTLACYAQLQDD